MKLAVVAEPFGFGPAAASCHLAMHLRGRVDQLLFAGRGHTLDLARRVDSFDAIVDLGDAAGPRALDSIAQRSDAALVCMDQELAARLAPLLPTVFYDALAWFWNEAPPPEIERCAGWVCQDFFGVRERVAVAGSRGMTAMVVPPLTDAPMPSSQVARTGRPLVNLGGIANPLIDPDDVDGYAVAMAGASAEACDRLGLARPLVITNSAAVAAVRASGLDAGTVAPGVARELTRAAPIVFATSGLANLYDSSAAGARVVWLPAANDSQLRQIDALRDAGMVDASVRWEDVTRLGAVPVGTSQAAFVAGIAERIRGLDGPESAARLNIAVTRAAQDALAVPAEQLSLPGLVHRFGHDAGDIAATAIVDVIVRSVGRRSPPDALAQRVRGVDVVGDHAGRGEARPIGLE